MLRGRRRRSRATGRHPLRRAAGAARGAALRRRGIRDLRPRLDRCGVLRRRSADRALGAPRARDAGPDDAPGAALGAGPAPGRALEPPGDRVHGRPRTLHPHLRALHAERLAPARRALPPRRAAPGGRHAPRLAGHARALSTDRLYRHASSPLAASRRQRRAPAKTASPHCPVVASGESMTEHIVAAVARDRRRAGATGLPVRGRREEREQQRRDAERHARALQRAGRARQSPSRSIRGERQLVISTTASVAPPPVRSALTATAPWRLPLGVPKPRKGPAGVAGMPTAISVATGGG